MRTTWTAGPAAGTACCPVIRGLLIILLLGFGLPADAAAPDPAFSGTPLSGAAPLSVRFTDASTGSPTGWAWYFGDETWTGTGWTLQSTGPWAAYRVGHGSSVLPDGSIILTGGMDQTENPPVFYNDTWRSSDKGVTWTLQNSDPGWIPRSSHSSVVLPDGSIVLQGGYSQRHDMVIINYNDTWRSTDKGITWSPQSSAPAWPARGEHTSVVLQDGSIVLMGGHDNKSVFYNDTWKSTDLGASWTQVSAKAPWIARWGHTSVVLPDGSIILSGGRDAAVTYYNDTWRSADKGATWSQVSAKAPWIARNGHTSVVMPDGSIILMGGRSDGADLNDVWRSTDQGASWARLADHAEWIPRSGHSSVVLPDASIIVSGGDERTGHDSILLNNSWRLVTADAAQNPAHAYQRAGTYPVTLQAYNPDGWNRLTRPAYIAVSGSPAPTPTASPVPSAAYSAVPDGGDDAPKIPLPNMTVTVNVGGNSAMTRSTVTGTGLSGLVLTGTTRPGPGAGVPPVPGTVYQYIDMVPAQFVSISGATIVFALPASWLEEQRLAPQDIVLYHYTGSAWTALPSTPGTNANGFVTVTSTGPGFSLHAISTVPRIPVNATATASPAPATIGGIAGVTPVPEPSRVLPEDPPEDRGTPAIPAGTDPVPAAPLPAILPAAALLLALLVRETISRRRP